MWLLDGLSTSAVQARARQTGRDARALLPPNANSRTQPPSQLCSEAPLSSSASLFWPPYRSTAARRPSVDPRERQLHSRPPSPLGVLLDHGRHLYRCQSSFCFRFRSSIRRPDAVAHSPTLSTPTRGSLGSSRPRATSISQRLTRTTFSIGSISLVSTPRSFRSTRERSSSSPTRSVSLALALHSSFQGSSGISLLQFDPFVGDVRLA